jgi:uroporphyrinogen-III synthase
MLRRAKLMASALINEGRFIETMTASLQGKRIALLEARLGGELARLVERYGGQAFSFPALREQTIDASAEVATLIDELKTDGVHIIVFQTGVGVAALFKEAEQLGRLSELLVALKEVTTVCRGPKPTAVLARHGIKAQVNARDPYTTTELLAAMAQLELHDKQVVILHYGERNAPLATALTERGARLTEMCLYEWQMPEDTTPLIRLIAGLQQDEFDAVAFTSQIQARHLFQLAQSLGQEAALRAALNQQTVVASIGPTCTAALRALGVVPRVEPEHPKMGPMVIALAAHFAPQPTTN